MSRVNSAGEPSMEELLVKVRQIIADEPARPAAVFPAIEPNPLVPQSFTDKDGKTGSGDASPSADRLSGMLKANALPATSPFGSKRPMSFDQDLADMLDEGSPGDAPKPAARATDFSAMSAKSDSAKADAAPPSPASSVADASLPPQFASTGNSAVDNAAVPPLFGTSSTATPAPDAPAPPRTFGFPPLKKAGFFPPQNAVTPTLPPLPPQSATPAAPAADVGGLDEALKRLTNLGAVVPGEPPAAREIAAPSFGAPQPFVPAELVAAAPVVANTPETPSMPAQDIVAAVPVAAAPVAAETAVGEPHSSVAAADSVAAPMAQTPVAPAAATFIEAAPIVEQISPEPVPAEKLNTLNGSKPYDGAVHSDPSVVAAQALDALAQGLAASAASAAAIPLTPVVEPAPSAGSFAAAAGRGLPPPASHQRTLEDMISDMVRPMLQKWVTDNMPRIMERALRSELAKSAPPGRKPPGA